jgi:hypothetical protein
VLPESGEKAGKISRFWRIFANVQTIIMIGGITNFHRLVENMMDHMYGLELESYMSFLPKITSITQILGSPLEVQQGRA